MSANIRKSWFFHIGFQAVCMLIAVTLMEIGVLSSFAMGLIYLTFIVIQGLKALKEDLLFTPVTPAFVFEICFALYGMRLVKSYTELTFVSMIVIVICMFLWKYISLSSLGVKKQKTIQNKELRVISQGSFLIIVSICFAVSAIAICFEWYKAGGIPAFRNDSETFRFKTSYSGIVHIFSILNKIVALVIGIYLMDKKISLKKDFIFIIEYSAAMFFMYCTAFRGELILAPCVMFIYYAIRHKISLKVYIIAGILAMLVVGAWPIIRMYRMYGAHYFVGQKNISTYPRLFFLTPAYQTFTNNFEVLNLDLSIFPKIHPFGFGDYSILPQIPFVDLGKSLGSVQNEVLDNGFYANLTATYLASWYADFGYIGCFLATLLYCGVTNFAYKKCLSTNSRWAYVWYGYTFYTALWIFYSSTFDFVYICYSLVIYVVFRVKIKN